MKGSLFPMRLPLRRGFTLIELLTVIAIIGILAAVLIPAAMGVQKRAKAANSQTVLSAWCSGIIRYKQAYGFYPKFVTTAYPTTDSLIKLESTVATSAYFVIALSGKQPSGAPPTSGATGQRAIFNRNSEAFVEFSPQDYEKPSVLSTAAITTGTTGSTIGTGNFLIDRFGNRNIRVVVDYDGNGKVSVTTGAPAAAAIPSDVAAYATTAGYPARVLIYTSKSDVNSADFTTQPAAGTSQSDFADVVAAQ